MKLKNVVPDIYEMMAKKIVEKITVDEIRDYFGDDLEPDMPDRDMKKFFLEWLMNDGISVLPEIYKRYIESPVVEETAVIRTQVVELPALNLSAVVETRMTRIGGMEDYEQKVVSIEIDCDEYEVDSDVEDIILSFL